MSARRFARRLVERLRPHIRGVCQCPACDKSEQRVRAQLGMPALHPERIARHLQRDQEEWLDAMAAREWPHDEYTAIIADPWGEDQS